jgi:exodeoxyribonuclease V gamma subunit
MTDFFKSPFKSYTSNSFKTLAKLCIENIHHQPLFSKTYLVYPSNETKDFFIQSFIEKNSSIFGIRFVTLQQCIHLLLKICYKKDLPFPSHYELMFFLEEKITSLLNLEEPFVYPLKEYIEGKKERIIPLASTLSHVFLEYLLYGDKALLPWLEKKGWQQYLFKEVLKKWTSIIDAIKQCPPPKFSLSIHIFVLDVCPKLYLNLIEKLSPYITFSFYLFSPSPLFWGDLISRKKSAYLDRHFKKKNTSLEERIEFASFASNTHPLLSHFCEGGKGLYTYLHDQGSFEEYEDITMSSDLTYIQKAILYQIKPSAPPYQDGTFSIHAAPSLLREVEVVINNILTLLHNKPHLHPSDITVLAPDIDIYYPYISFLFSGKNFPFTFTISNLQKTKHCPTMDSLKQLFSMIDSRFEKDALLKLFSSPLFQRKCQINQEDVETLEKIISYTGISWGFDKQSKSAVLDGEACSFGLFEKGFSHILDVLTMKDSPIEFSQAESIGDVIDLVQKLHEQAQSFVHKKYTLQQWSAKTIAFAEQFLYLDDSADLFFKELKKITTLSTTSQFCYSYSSFKRLLGEIFAKKGGKDSMYSSPPITFSSIEDAPPLDKALFFIGLDEEHFPSKERYRSLHELSKEPLYDKKPTSSQKARLYLLKAIMGSKESVCFSYTSNNPTDGRETNPSPLIEEMIHALCLPPPIQHPFTPYNTTYFLQKNVFSKHYPLFLASNEPYTPPYTFEKGEKKESLSQVIEIKHLNVLARSPGRFFYTVSAHLFEQSLLSKTPFDDGEFFLSHLDKSKIASALSRKEEINFEHLTLTNKLPGAIFEKVAKKELTSTIQTQKGHLITLFNNINPYFSITLDPHIKASIKKDSTLFLPAIVHQEMGLTYTIKGTINNLTDKGLILFKEPKLPELWKHLPTLILLSHLDVDIPLALLFVTEGVTKTFEKSTLQPLLSPLLSYYQKAMNAISPLIPEAVEEYCISKTIDFPSIKEKLRYKDNDPFLEKGEVKSFHHFEEELSQLCSALNKEIS